MTLRCDFRLWHPALLAAAGLLPIAGCGGSTDRNEHDLPGGSANEGGTSAGGGGREAPGGTGGTSIVSAPGGSGTVGGRPDVVVDCSNAVSLGNGYEYCGGVLHRSDPAACNGPGDCRTDEDCGAGSACVCSRELSASCQSAQCRSDADCPDGSLCVSGDVQCGQPFVHNLACVPKQAPATDCSTVGRPFLVAGRVRSAELQSREDWQCAELNPDVSGLSLEARAALARHWHEAALMEHASIAAFSRFVLDLMSLGAPPELIEDATRAMLDESGHAKACFALANAFAGSNFGPSPLSVVGSLDQRHLEEIVVSALREGCIGETVAAMEAAEALEHAVDEAVRRTLQQIVQDELRHAALAFRFVRWAIARFGEDVRRITNETLQNELTPSPPRSDSVALSVPSHGLLPSEQRAEVRSRVLAELVAPTLPLLLAA